MGKKLTHDDFMKRVFEKVGNEYLVLGEYNGADTKVLFKHNVCGSEYMATPYKFNSGRRCPVCAGNKKKTPEEFAEQFNKLVGDGYDLLDVYQGAHAKVKVKHKECGNIYKVAPTDFISGKRCRVCSQLKFIGNRLKPQEKFEKDFHVISNGEYELMSDYKNDSSYITVKHKECGRIYDVNASSFLQGRKCKPCAKKAVSESQRWSQSLYEEKVEVLGLGEYEVLGQYTLSVNKIEMKHTKCGRVYKVDPSNFIQGSRCPGCQSSRGELKVELYLREKGYKYISQYRFDDCKHKRPLPFDFAVFENGSIVCLIEYQGRQHFTPIEVFGGEKGYNLTKKRDAIKKEYCHKNNIPLIEIPYTVKDVESFLTEALTHYANPEPSALEIV